MSKILLIEDDIDLATKLQELFSANGLLLEIATSAEDGMQLLVTFQYEMLLLDWDLPVMSGLEFCRRYRAQGGRAYIVFLTGKHSIEAKEQAFDAGADDYVTKPFDVREVFARMKSIRRRSLEIMTEVLQIRSVSLDPASRVVRCGEASIHLTAKECALLEHLMRHPDRSFNAQKLLNAIWPSDSDVSVETVRTWIRYLRVKLTELGQPDLIKTVAGAGYVIEKE